MKPRRHTHSPAYCCCVSVEPGGVQRRADVLACSLEAASCVCYVLTAACTSACAQRVQPRSTRSTTCSLLAGPLSCCRPASGSLRRATRSWTILGATASARTLATAHHAHPEHIYAQPSHYRSPQLTVLVVRALSQCLPSEMGASSGSGSDGRAARGVCVDVCASVCALWAARASGSARENRAQFR